MAGRPQAPPMPKLSSGSRGASRCIATALVVARVLPCTGEQIKCYPRNCTDAGSWCSTFPFCKVYVAETSLNTVINKDIDVTVAQVVRQARNQAIWVVAALIIVGVLSGWISLFCMDICSEDFSNCRKLRHCTRCQTFWSRGFLGMFSLLILAAVAIAFCIIAMDVQELVKLMQGGIISKTLKQLVVGFMDNVLNVSDVDEAFQIRQGTVWNMPIENPTTEKLTIDVFASDVRLHDMYLGNLDMQDGDALHLLGKEEGRLQVFATASLFGGLLGAAQAYLAYQAEGNIEMGFWLSGEGTFAEQPYKFEAAIVLPLDTTKWPRPYTQLADSSLFNYSTILKCLETGLIKNHKHKEAMLDLDTLSVQSPQLSKLFYLFVALGVAVFLVATTCACICCSSCVGEEIRSGYSSRGLRAATMGRLQSVKSLRRMPEVGYLDSTASARQPVGAPMGASESTTSVKHAGTFQSEVNALASHRSAAPAAFNGGPAQLHPQGTGLTHVTQGSHFSVIGRPMPDDTGASLRPKVQFVSQPSAPKAQSRHSGRPALDRE